MNFYKKLNFDSNIVTAHPENISLLMAFQGKLSILSYSEEMITNFLNNEKLLHFQNIYSSFQSFKETMETMDDLDLDDWYYLNKSVLNDFLFLLNVMKKSKKLMEVY